MSGIVEDRSGNYNTADGAEEKIIEEMRYPGNEPMQVRASGKEAVRVAETKKLSENIVGHGKKNCFGIEHSEK